MNQKLKKLVLLATVAGLPLTLPGTLHAQINPVLEKISISATEIKQGNTSSTSTKTTTAAPTKKPISTPDLIRALAQDEGLSPVPPGASVDYNTVTGDFQLDYGTNQLDVSSILSLSIDETTVVTNGTFLNADGSGVPPYSQTYYAIATLTYTSPTNGGLQFTVTGVGSSTTTASTPNSLEKFKQTGSISLSDGTGTSVGNGGNGSILTGFTINGSGSAKETNSPPSN